jgi:hypothetical protein
MWRAKIHEWKLYKKRWVLGGIFALVAEGDRISTLKKRKRAQVIDPATSQDSPFDLLEQSVAQRRDAALVAAGRRTS